jgi:hypothetical protein
MQRFKRLSLFSVAVIGLGAALGWGLRHSGSLGGGNESTKLWIPPEALSMGTIWESEEFAWTVPIENHEAAPVEVESFGTTCNCLSIEPKSFVLQPGEQRQLALKINLTSQVKETGQIAVGLWAKVKKETRKPGEPLGPEWRINAQVRQVLKFNRRLLYVGQYSELAQPLPIQTIPLEVLAPLESLSAQCDLVGFTAKVQGLQEGKPQVQLLSVTPRGIGPFEGTVTLRPVLKRGEKLPVQRLQFEGKIVPDIEAVPPAVQVGGRILGETFEDVVVLRSLTGREIASVRAKPDGKGLEVELEPLQDKFRFRIRQKVVSAGESSNKVYFFAKVSGHDMECTLPVIYTGIESD